MYDTLPYYTEDGINKGKDYTCTENEYGLLDYTNKRFIIKTIPPPDDKKVKKTLITFKRNDLASIVRKDVYTGRSYVDNISAKGIVFKGTEKELAHYATELMSKGFNIQDFYEQD